MKELEQFTEQNYQIPYECIGKVVNNIDTKDRGRLQVRIYGIIDDSVSDSNCPWCETEGPLFGSNKDTVGVSSVPKIGTFVYVNFLYHNPSFPKVTGVVRGKTDSSLLHTVKNLSTTISQTRTDNLIGPELAPLNSSSVYPNNNVIETDSSIIEIDDTEGNERVSIQHKNGSYVELRPDGDIQIKSIKDEYNIIKGNLEEYIKGKVNEKIIGTWTKEASSSTITSSTTTHIGDLIVTGDVIIGGISKASDHISDDISGKNHTHTDSIGGTVTPPLP